MIDTLATMQKPLACIALSDDGSISRRGPVNQQMSVWPARIATCERDRSPNLPRMLETYFDYWSVMTSEDAISELLRPLSK